METHDVTVSFELQTTSAAGDGTNILLAWTVHEGLFDGFFLHPGSGPGLLAVLRSMLC